MTLLCESTAVAHQRGHAGRACSTAGPVAGLNSTAVAEPASDTTGDRKADALSTRAIASRVTNLAQRVENSRQASGRNADAAVSMMLPSSRCSRSGSDRIEVVISNSRPVIAAFGRTRILEVGCDDGVAKLAGKVQCQPQQDRVAVQVNLVAARHDHREQRAHRGCARQGARDLRGNDCHLR